MNLLMIWVNFNQYHCSLRKLGESILTNYLFSLLMFVPGITQPSGPQTKPPFK